MWNSGRLPPTFVHIRASVLRTNLQFLRVFAIENMALNVELSVRLHQIIADNNFPVAVIENLRGFRWRVVARWPKPTLVDAADFSGLAARAQDIGEFFNLLEMEGTGATPEGILRTMLVATRRSQPSLDDNQSNQERMHQRLVALGNQGSPEETSRVATRWSKPATLIPLSMMMHQTTNSTPTRGTV